jgi:hypothetical protein
MDAITAPSSTRAKPANRAKRGPGGKKDGTLGQSGNVWEWQESAFDKINDFGSDRQEILRSSYVRRLPQAFAGEESKSALALVHGSPAVWVDRRFRRDNLRELPNELTASPVQLVSRNIDVQTPAILFRESYGTPPRHELTSPHVRSECLPKPKLMLRTVASYGVARLGG